MTENAIRFIDVTKYHGTQRILDGLRFSVRKGEYFGLVGVNGAGKTTCINSLLDFCNIDSGSIAIFGLPHREPRARAALSFLPEQFLPPYYLTGGDLLRYMMRLHGAPYRERDVLSMFDKLDLARASLTKPVRDHSRGMAQKLGLASCLLSRKPLLVLDEPFSGLDPKARRLVKQQLLGLRSNGTHTLFFSTHRLQDVEELCDRLGVLHQGRLRFVGTPRECRLYYGVNTLEDAFIRCIA
uniref:ABC-2 type transport system ATP-binding protein n=1 Tax=Candidatus Kentrum sp. MB TaxID=2138164 RepID=A0A450X0Y5_9GAMM|nr:MAG: ABC-2 type transport system ATP-binding protein [Candidatus Kentron sp. MB]VFK26568.1 MAG: ABC-2 type transport system ATP-binding protein [Candidatus Kentron sp. MB]VFK74544.1 MAG: ABC-2 type transport system ATP-binding protein [Candidatus Kentron sp. MB]